MRPDAHLIILTQSTRLPAPTRLLPYDYFPRAPQVVGACLTSSSLIWLNVHFYP